MKNATSSEIIIKMNHIDNANRLFKALKELKKQAGYGGDIELFNYKDRLGFIGHDVNIISVDHKIHG